MNIQQKLKDNITSLRLVLENNGKKLNSQQVEQLKRYSGFGGLKQVLWGDGPIETWSEASESDKKLYPLYQELYQLLDDNLTGREYKAVLDSLKNSILTAFYTPTVIPRVFYEVLQKYHNPQNLLEPSAGVGVFITEAKGILDLNYIVSYEKDVLTGKLLETIVPRTWNDGMSSPTRTEGGVAFENSDPGEEDFDLIVSNIPFGAHPVYDDKLPLEVKTKIHNYFFAKGLEKLREGGILAYLVTSAFLDTVTNKSAREYLFNRADFISLTVMPDNLMWETGGTQAPSHFLVVRKNSKKTLLSTEEQLLCVSENTQVGNGKANVTISRNKYIAEHNTDIVLGSMKVGTNQYGKPNIEVLWSGNINDIAESFRNVLERDFRARYTITGKQYIQMQSTWVNEGTIPETATWDKIDIGQPKTEFPLPDDYVEASHIQIPGDTTDGITDDWEDEDSLGIGVDHEDEQEDYTESQEVVEQQGDAYNEPQQTEPVKKLSKRDQEVLKSYYKIKEAYKNLEENGTG